MEINEHGKLLRVDPCVPTAGPGAPIARHKPNPKISTVIICPGSGGDSDSLQTTNNRALAMGILNRRVEKWAVKVQTEEMSEFVSRLESMDGPEIGLELAMATHWKNLLSLNAELMDPVYYVSVNPMVDLEFERMVRNLQKQGRNLEAIGLMVWLHTLRAAMNQDLRGLGRKMWKELARGFPFVHESADSYRYKTGIVLQIEYSALYPEGFSPEPV